MSDLSKYPKHVFWSDEDEGFIAIAPDLRGCSAYGETEVVALAELDNAIEAWIDAARAVGNDVPAPSQPALRKEYSGKLLVRMPQSLHKDLAIAARREDVSLNQFIVFVLARYSSASDKANTFTGSIVLTDFVPNVSSPYVSGVTASRFSYWEAVTTRVSTDILPHMVRTLDENQSWSEVLGGLLEFQGKTHDAVAKNVFYLDTLAKSERE